MVLHGFQIGKQRGHTLVNDEWVSGIVGRKTHPDGGEAGDRFQKQLEILVGRFALPTSGQALAGQQKRRHVLCQIGQRRQRLRKRAQEFADVITRCYSVLVSHGLHDHDRGEHVWREIRKSGPKNVRVDDTDACEENSGKSAAREGEIGVLGRGHAVDVDHCRGGVVGMSSGSRVGGPRAIYRWLAVGDVNWVGEVDGHEIPFCI
jgi:hypothetical protein